MTRIDEEKNKEYEEKERKWRGVAEKRGFRCERCDKLIDFSERDGYFLSENSYCSYCDHVTGKDD